MLPISTQAATAMVLALSVALPFGATGALGKEGNATGGMLGVSEVRLYTLPAQPICGKPVRLIAEIHTTKPGKVNFVLHRREGRSQNASLTTQKDEDGYAERWSREYVYKYSVRREYRIVVKDEKFSTNWVPVEVTCSASGQHKGIASLIRSH